MILSDPHNFPRWKRGMLELAYETAKGVNIHFYLLSKLFMSISPHCTQPQTHGGGRRSEMDKQGLCHCERLLLCDARGCGGSEHSVERSLWHEMNTLFRSDVKASHLKPSHLLPQNPSVHRYNKKMISLCYCICIFSTLAGH